MRSLPAVVVAGLCLLSSASPETCISETCIENDQGSLLQVEIGRHDQAARKEEEGKWGDLFECAWVGTALSLFRGTLDSQITMGIEQNMPFTYTALTADGSVDPSLDQAMFEALGCSGDVESITGSVKTLTFEPSDLDIQCLKGQLTSTLTLQIDVHIPKVTLGTSVYGTLNATCGKFPWAPVNNLTDLFNLTYSIEDIKATAVVQGQLSGTTFNLTKAESAKVSFGAVKDFECQLVQERHGNETAEVCSSTLELDLKNEQANIEVMINKVLTEQVLPDLPQKLSEFLAANSTGS